HKLRAALTETIEQTMNKFALDALVLPYRTLPPPAGTTYSRADGNSLTSVTGLPGIIVPGGYTKDNLPVGIQFITRRFEDLDLLKIAHGYEAVSKKRKPPESVPPLPGEQFEY